ncbi:MAG: winged helix-turn-helix transcriptional regulator [Lachnospiraceae bacterium]|nr:winged helix-turn-helix transcriptional regulator [Lachnospiraceae bacterium]
MNNPFSLTFGKTPNCFVDRPVQIQEILEEFQSDTPSSQVYIITGVRGSGKTVTMTQISKELDEQKDWIVISLNPNRDLLSGLASNLAETKGVKGNIKEIGLGASILGIGVNASVEKNQDIEVTLDKMFQYIKKHDLKVLVTIDEVTNSENIKIFASAFQIFLRKDYPIFLLMTGLFENIRTLQDEDSLTFLYRCPRIDMKPLGTNAIINSYLKVFDIERKEATQMAVFTKGYPYAFQVLGYLKWKNNVPYEKLIPEFDSYMEEYVYEKIWAELSEGDRRIVSVLAKNGKMKTKAIQEETGNTSSSFSTYRKRLSQKGLIDTSSYGYCELILPRFAEIVQSWDA